MYDTQCGLSQRLKIALQRHNKIILHHLEAHTPDGFLLTCAKVFLLSDHHSDGFDGKNYCHWLLLKISFLAGKPPPRDLPVFFLHLSIEDFAQMVMIFEPIAERYKSMEKSLMRCNI